MWECNFIKVYLNNVYFFFFFNREKIGTSLFHERSRVLNQGCIIAHCSRSVCDEYDGYQLSKKTRR